MRSRLTLVFFLFFFTQLAAKPLQPGFDGNEFRKMFQISGHQSDTPWVKIWMPYPVGYTMTYRSPITGLDNRWDLWTGPDSVDVISIRGTTATMDSWLGNLYAGMIPANGSLPMDNGKKFEYHLSNDTNAYVHIGWMIGLASMADDIVSKINTEYKKGIRDFVIMGHSQGGAIGFLLTSYLYYGKGKFIPADIRFKTYASGVPKPGNIFYGYDFDFITRGGWALRVINTVDWVAEVPFSIQTLDDLSKGSPFESADALHGPVKWYANHIIRKMNRSARHARRRFEKYLAHKAGRLVRKQIDGFPRQQYIRSMNYAPCGVPVILQPDKHYYELYKPDPKNIFRHHGFGPYLYLLNLHYPVT